MLPSAISRSCGQEAGPPLSSESKSSSRVILPSFSSAGNENPQSLPSSSASRTNLVTPSFRSSRTRSGESVHIEGDHTRLHGENPPPPVLKKSGLLPYLENVHNGSISGVLGSSESSHSRKERKSESPESHSFSRHLFRSSRGRRTSKEVNSFPSQSSRKRHLHGGNKSSTFLHPGESQTSPDDDGGLTSTASMLISISGASQKLSEACRNDRIESASLRMSPGSSMIPLEQWSNGNAQMDNNGGGLRGARGLSRTKERSNEIPSQHGSLNFMHGSPLHSANRGTPSSAMKHRPHHLSNELTHQGSIPRLERADIYSGANAPMVTLRSINSSSASNINSTIRSAKEVLRKRALPHSGPMRSSSFYKSSTSSSAASRKRNNEARPSPPGHPSTESQVAGSTTGHRGRSSAPESDGSIGSTNGRGGAAYTSGLGYSEATSVGSHRSGLVGSITSFLQPEHSSGEESPLDFSPVGSRSGQRQQAQVPSTLASTISHNALSHHNGLVEMLDTSLCHDTMLSPSGGSGMRESKRFNRQLTNGNIGASSLSGAGGLLSFTQGGLIRRVEDSMEGGSDSDADSDELVHRHQERVHMRMQCLTQRNSEESHLGRTTRTIDSLSRNSDRASVANSDSRSFTALGGGGGELNNHDTYNGQITYQGAPLEMPVLGGCEVTPSFCRMMSSSASKGNEQNTTKESWVYPQGDRERNGDWTAGEDGSSCSPDGLALFEEKYPPLNVDPNYVSVHNNNSTGKNNENGFVPFTALFLPVESSPSKERESWNGLGVNDYSSEDWYARMRKNMMENSDNEMLGGTTEYSDREKLDVDCPERDHTITNKDSALCCVKSCSSTNDGSRVNSDGSSSKIQEKSTSKTAVIVKSDIPLSGEAGPKDAGQKDGHNPIPLALPVLGRESGSLNLSKDIMERPPTTEKPKYAPRRDPLIF